MKKTFIETIGEKLLLNELDDIVDVDYEGDCLFAKLEEGIVLKIEIAKYSSFTNMDKIKESNK